MTSAWIHVPGLGLIPWITLVVAGILIAGAGVQLADWANIGILGGVGPLKLLGSLGMTLIIIGAAIAMYGVTPQHASLIFGIAFLLVALAGLLEFSRLVHTNISGH